MADANLQMAFELTFNADWDERYLLDNELM